MTHSRGIPDRLGGKEEAVKEESFVEEYLVIDITCLTISPELFDRLIRSSSEQIISIPAVDLQSLKRSAEMTNVKMDRELSGLLNVYQLYRKNKKPLVLSSSGCLSDNFSEAEELEQPEENADLVILESCRQLMRNLKGEEKSVFLLTQRKALRARALKQNIEARTPWEFWSMYKPPFTKSILSDFAKMAKGGQEEEEEGEGVSQMKTYVVLDTNVFITCLYAVHYMFSSLVGNFIFLIPNVVFMELRNLDVSGVGRAVDGVVSERSKLQNDAKASIALIEGFLTASSSNGGGSIRGLQSSGSIHAGPLDNDKTIISEYYGDNDGIILNSCIKLEADQAKEGGEQGGGQGGGQSGGGSVILLTLDKQLRERAELSHMPCLTPTEFVNMCPPLAAHIPDVANGTTTMKLLLELSPWI
ncbi:hypothetical protein Aperf_G00000027850 [Anoplocephala perfoliata]